MSVVTHDVVALGNAIVDVLSHEEDAFIDRHNLNRGTMQLVDADRAIALYEAMGPGITMSGGSASNTVAGLASLGGKAAFIGKVRDDQLGEVFRHDIRATGVHFETLPLEDGPPTARCLIVITPDAQRTMSTFLGASVEFAEDDIDEDLIAASKVTYLEGYLFDRPAAKNAFRRAASIARNAGRKIALSLSDPFCVERHRDDLRALVENDVDILFANEAEITSLYQTNNFDDAVAALTGNCETAALTRSEKGSVIISGVTALEIPAEPVAKVVDTTGAGDLYAAGFLFGYTRGRDPAECARIAGICAAEVISHTGARPERSLKDLVAERLD